MLAFIVLFVLCILAIYQVMVDKSEYGFGRSKVTEISHYWIPLRDGVRLSARIWVPDGRSHQTFSSPFASFNSVITGALILGEGEDLGDDEKFPAILEYLPYCKDLVTASRDHARHPWFASHGFVLLRVEIRGTGASEGHYYGEYLPQEQQDCSEVLAWVAAQSWSNGRVGMYGKSWGGFNGLQQAFVEGTGSPLATAVSLYSTDDRLIISN